MSTPRIGIALGGGAARGLAHIRILEVFDELGIKPSVVVGTSAGALIGAAYASGLDARTIRDHTLAVLGNRVHAARRIFASEKSRVVDLINFNPFSSPVINGVALTLMALPDGVAARVEDTAITFKVIATDFFGHREMVIESGILHDAVAASIAIPGVIAAPKFEGRTLIDGACVNPVPFDRLGDDCDITIGIDVTGGPMPRGRRGATSTDLLAGSMQIQQRMISNLKRLANPPDIYIVPAIDRFRVHDFFKVQQILDAAEPAKAAFRAALEAQLG